MNKKLAVIGLAGLMVLATAAWAQWMSSLDDLFRDRLPKGTLTFVRDVNRHVDSLTTMTATQQSVVKTKLTDALCSASTIRGAAVYFNATEKTILKSIIDGYVDEYETEQAAEAARLKALWK